MTTFMEYLTKTGYRKQDGTVDLGGKTLEEVTKEYKDNESNKKKYFIKKNKGETGDFSFMKLEKDIIW